MPYIFHKIVFVANDGVNIHHCRFLRTTPFYCTKRHVKTLKKDIDIQKYNTSLSRDDYNVLFSHESYQYRVRPQAGHFTMI